MGRAVDERAEGCGHLADAPRSEPGAADWSAGIVNFNGDGLVCDTITSLKAMTHPPSEILLIDDGSTDGSVAAVAREHPDVRIESMGRNTQRPNLARNRILTLAQNRYVLLTDNDILFEADAGLLLLEALRRLDDAAVCTPVVLYREDRTTVLNQGHALHFLCWSTRSHQTLTEARAGGARRAVGCGIQMIDRLRISKVGLLDDGMALGWGDDGEFHFRVELAGLGCYSIPDAVVFHPQMRAQSRFYGQVHNRWRMLLKDYQWRTLVVAAPALVLYEVVLVAALIAMGAGRDYRRALADVAASLPEIMRQRWLVQALREVSDGEILYAELLAAPARAQKQGLLRLGLGAMSVGFRLYWSVARRLLSHVPHHPEHAG